MKQAETVTGSVLPRGGELSALTLAGRGVFLWRNVVGMDRVTTCLENLEMSGNLKHVMEM